MFSVALLNTKVFYFTDFHSEDNDACIITIVRHSFLKLKNLDLKKKKKKFIKNSTSENNSQGLVYIIGKQLHQLMKITEQETLYYFTGNT